MPRGDERALYAAQRPVRCGRKKVHQDDLTETVIRLQKSDVNAVHLLEVLDHIDLGSCVSCLFDRSFVDVENDDYGYDNDIDDMYFGVEQGLDSRPSYTEILAFMIRISIRVRLTGSYFPRTAHTLVEEGRHSLHHTTCAFCIPMHLGICSTPRLMQHRHAAPLHVVAN